MEEENTYTIYCSRCGSEMKNSSRYCMKCGNLNINHPDNKGMVKYIKDNKDDYSITGGNVYINSGANNHINLTSLRNSFKSCFIFNVVLYFIMMLIIFLIYYNSLGDINSLLKSNIFNSIILVSISFIYAFAYELMFVKMGCSWWKALIPIYNIVLLSKRIFKNDYIWLLIFIPFVGEIYLLVLLYKLGIKFGKSGILTALFPMIMIILISLGESLFEDTRVISEEDYAYCFKLKKYFIIICSFFIFVSIVLVLFNNSIFDSIRDYFSNRFNEVKEIFGWK